MTSRDLIAACSGVLALRHALAPGESGRHLRLKIYTAVYAGGYDGTGPVPGEGILPGRTDPGFVEETLRLVPDRAPGDNWVLIGCEDGMADLEADGLRAVAPVDDLVGTLEPGRQVRVLGVSAIPGRIPGFFFRHGVFPLTAPLSRLYLNISPKHAAWVLGPLARWLDGVGVPFQMKVLADPESYYRSDAAVVYVPSVRIRDALRFCAEAHRRGDLQTDARVPLLTRAVEPGLAVADEPDDVAPVGQSHGAWVTGLLVNALDSASNALGMARRVEDGIIAAGRNPDRPFQRITAVQEISTRAPA